MRAQIPLFLGGLFLSSAIAGSSDCLNGVVTAVTQFTFSTTDDYYTSLCQNDLSLESMWAAAKLYCTPDEIIAGSASIENTCITYGFIHLVPYETVLPNLTDTFIASLQVVNFNDIGTQDIWNNSILISEALFKTGLNTYAVFNREAATHKRYGWGVYGYWGGILLIGIIARFIEFVSQKNSTRQPDGEAIIESQSSPSLQNSYSLSQKVYGWTQAKIVVPSVVGTYHRRLLWGCSVPTRIQGFVVLAYWIWSVIICAVTYDVFYPNLYYTSNEQIWRYLSDRTGTLAYANLAVIWMFSGRNNIFLWATGWEFATFNLFHRHVARIATIQAIVHSVGYTILELEEGGYFAEWNEQYWYMGALAIITMSLLLGASSVFLRQRAYELFVILHVVLSLVTLISLFFHTKIFNGTYDPYLWPLVAIWSFDRLARIVRQVYCNIHVKLSGDVTTTKSTIQYIPDAELLILDVILGSKTLKPKPNQHYYLYQPLRWRGWENHPFTVASWTEPNSRTEGISIPARVGSSSTPIETEKPNTTMATKPVFPLQSSTSAEQTKLTFYIRASSSKNSFTAHLRSLCLARNEPVPIKILLEGPYGHSSSLHEFDNVLLIAGGTGISSALPHLKSHLQGDVKSSIKNLRFIWATKQVRMVHEIFTRELASLPVTASTEVGVFVTGKTETGIQASPSDREISVEGEKKQLGQELMATGVKYGRPNIEKLIREVAEDKGSASMAVLVCGPVGMADEARAVVVECLNGGIRRIKFIEEVFGW